MAKVKRVKRLKREKRVKSPAPPRPQATVMTDVSQEQIVLAAMMADRTVLRDLATSIRLEEFLAERHREIFAGLQRMARRGLGFSLEAFEAETHGRVYGGRKYVSGIVEAYPSPLVNLDFHVDRLHLASLKARLRVGGAQRLCDLCSDPAVELETLQSEARAVMKNLDGHGVHDLLAGEDLEKWYLSDVYGRIETGAFSPTGFPGLDESLIEGLARKRISVWTARPSIGKSTFAWNMALRQCMVYKNPTVYFALEMNADAIMDGMVAATTTLPLDLLVKNPDRLTRNQIKQVERSVRELTETGLLAIWDKSVTLEKAARIIREGKFKLAIWDLWEKMVRQKKQDVIAGELDRTQQLAKDTDCHQALFHQTRRGVEQRKNKRPTMEDLKNSGGYEEVADLVCGLYREKFYKPNVDLDVLEVGILKQRRGMRFKWPGFHFDGPHGRVGDQVEGWEPNFGG